MADLSKLRFNGTDYNVKDASAPKRKFDNTYAKTGNLPITSDDTIQSAVGKLEKAHDTNQSNILYVSEHNANRNLLLNTASTTTIDGVTFTVNADKSVTITGSQNNPNQHAKFVLGKFTANRSDLVLDSGIAASASANIFINTQDGVTTTRNLGHATITGTDLNTERDYQILVIAGTSNINTTIKPMICTQADWNATQEYEASGGLPNYDLTRLEAEDRASLAEEIDSGAKNIVDLSTAGTGTRNAVTFTNLGDNRYKINGTPSTYDTYLDIMGSWSTVPSFISENVGKTLVFSTDQEDVYYGVIPIIGGTAQEYIGGNKSKPREFTVPNNLSGLLLRIFVDTYGTYNNVTTELLVCTKAAFYVSKKFVPYAKTNYQLTAELFKISYTTPTKHSYITSVRSGGYFRVGNIVIVNIVCTVGTALPLYQVLFTDLPTPVADSSLGAGDGVAVLSTNKGCVLSLTKSGQIINYESAIEAGGLEISGVYVCL